MSERAFDTVAYLTKPLDVVLHAVALREDDWNVSQIARHLGVSRAAVRDWLADPGARIRRLALEATHDSEHCSLRGEVPWPEYAYLLGQYLGDGCMSPGPRGVFKLRIATCDAYPDIRERCVMAITACMPNNKVGIVPSIGCSEVNSHSKHWPCLIPQHGPGRKHEREIRLADWQDEIVSEFPREFVAGLIHSDGSRCINRIPKSGKVYEYPRYFFTNVSLDILMLCAAALDLIGVEWKQNRWNSLSVAKKESVALLDSFIGPKS